MTSTRSGNSRGTQNVGGGPTWIRDGQPGRRSDVCTYNDDCPGEPSGRFPVDLCDDHAIKVHELVEMTLAMARVRETVAEKNRVNAESLSPSGPSPFRQHVSDIVDEWGAIKTGPEGSVYYVRFGPMVKIGFSRNPEKRLKAIPHQEILRITPGTMFDERSAHAKCSRWRVVGEWFHDCPEFREAAGLDTPAGD